VGLKHVYIKSEAVSRDTKNRQEKKVMRMTGAGLSLQTIRKKFTGGKVRMGHQKICNSSHGHGRLNGVSNTSADVGGQAEPKVGCKNYNLTIPSKTARLLGMFSIASLERFHR
jgi:hypothetical protein